MNGAFWRLARRGTQRRATRSLFAALFLLALCLLTLSAAAQSDDSEAYEDYEYEYDAPAVAPNASEIEKHVDENARQHPFCTDPEYVLHRAERPLCSFADSASERCPAFSKVCARPPELDRGRLGRGTSGRGGDRRAKDETDPEEEAIDLKLPAAIATLFRLLFWVLVTALLLAIAYLLVTALTKGARSKDEGDDDAPGDAPELKATPSPQVVESDVLRLLRRAKERAVRGEYSPAVDDVYAALLRYLEGEQLLVLERFRTNGDYLRALRSHPEWQQLVREIGRDVERAQFGNLSPDASTFERLLRRIEPVITRAIAMALIVLGSLLQLACDASDGPTRQKEWGPMGDHSADGLSLFSGLLTESGYSVRQRIRRVADLDENVGLLIVYDNTSLEDEDWDRLKTWVESGKELWLTGDRAAAAAFGSINAGARCEPPFAFTDLYLGTRYVTAQSGTERPVEIHSISGTLLPNSEFSPVLTCNGQPMVSRATYGVGTVTVFADSSLLTNASMLTRDNAIALVSMVRAYPMTVEFAGGLTGAGADSPYEALLNANLGQVLLQIALLMLVLYLAKGIPFATLRDPKERGRRRFMDHLSALGRVFQRAGARQHALHHYAAWALNKLNDRIRPGQRLSLIELGTALSKRTGRPQAEIMETLADAAMAKTQSEGQNLSSGDELEVLKKLDELVIETGGAR